MQPVYLLGALDETQRGVVDEIGSGLGTGDEKQLELNDS
jgi:hypothetical protein